MNRAISFILVAFLVLFPVLAAGNNAQGSTTIDVNYSVSIANTVTISGITENVPLNAKLTIIIFKGENGINNIVGNGTSDIDVVSAIEDVYLNPNGEWSFNWRPLYSDYYNIHVSSKYFGQTQSVTRYVAANRSEIISTIVGGSEDELTELFSDIENIKAIIIDNTLYDDITDTQVIGSIVYSIRSELESSEDILNYLALCCKLAKLGETPSADLLDDVVSVMKNQNFNLKNVAIYENATDDIKTAMANRLCKYVDRTFTEFNKFFTESLILCGVHKSTNYASVTQYLDLLDNNTYKTNKTKVAKAVVGKSYTMAGLLSAIESAVYSGGGSLGGGGSSGGGSSGGVSSVPSTNLVPENVVSVEKPDTKPLEEKYENLITFSDVPGTHWAFDAINYLRWKDIVNGNENGEFLPDNNITRAEFVKILCSIYGIQELNKSVFNDVNDNHWCYGYIAAAYQNKFIQGDGNAFYPDSYITRQDLTTMIYRVTQHYDIQFDNNELAFGDNKDISEYAEQAVGKLSAAGIIRGKDNGNFEPLSLSTRAESAALIYRLLNYCTTTE